jgi:hypothetical protein
MSERAAGETDLPPATPARPEADGSPSPPRDGLGWLYILVVVELIACIILFYLFSRAFS